jgi:DNA-binding FadR family transcriptional regulator
MLEMIGMVNARVGSGRYVSVDGSPSLNRGLETWMHVQPIDDIIAVRRVIEPAAIGSIPATQVSVVSEECSAILNRMSAALRKGKHEAAMRYHTQLHLALIQYSPVNLMRTLLASMIHTSETAQLEIFRNSRAGQASIAVHVAIVDALAQGDVHLTAERVAGHLTPAFVLPADHAKDDQFDN